MPKNDRLPGIIIELKAEKNCDEENLKKLAKSALGQLYEKKYDVEMKARGIEKIYGYGVAFSGKSVEVEVKDSSSEFIVKRM